MGDLGKADFGTLPFEKSQYHRLMIFDANDFEDGCQLAADVCVVGAGAAGITLALELIGSEQDVLLLESGGLQADRATQDLYAGEVANALLHSPPDLYRQRRFGGSTTIWAGRCAPFDAIDFQAQEGRPLTGWPLDLEMLEPFYARANLLCEAGAFAYTEGDAFDRRLRPMLAGLESEAFSTNTLERFSCPTDFGARYEKELRDAANVRVVLNANVTGIALNQAGSHVDTLEVRTLKARRLTVAARRFVLATGGLEVARLLLASRNVQAAGIGNHHDLVGRHYMSHLAGTLGELRLSEPREAVSHGYNISDDGIYCRRRLALRPDLQRREHIGNFVARLHHPRIINPEHGSPILSLLYLARFLIPDVYNKRLFGEDTTSVSTWLHHVRNVAAGPGESIGFAWHMLRDRVFAKRKFPSIIIQPKAGVYSIDFHAEQQPNPASRVSLSSSTDALGMPRIRVDWRYSPGDVETVTRAFALLARDVERSGIGRLDYDPQSVELEMTRYGAYGGHHIGTTRMGNDQRTSVVNADCRLHDVDNLYISSAAVFPTSSQANPTLTVVALAIRLASTLKLFPPV